MARNARINIDIDSKRAKKATDDLANSVGDVSEKTKNATTRLTDMQDALFELEPGTEEFRKMAKEAGTLQSTIDKANEEIRSFASDTMALDGAVGVIQGMTGAYSSVTAISALFGQEQSKLIEVFARLELIQRSVNGAIQTYQALQRGSAAMTLIQSARSKVLNFTRETGNRINRTAITLTGQSTAATNLQSAATTRATFATRALSTAMKAIPILAIVAGITALVSWIMKLTSSTEDASRAQEKLTSNYQAQAEAFKKRTDFLNNQLEIESTQEILDINNELIQANRRLDELRLKQPNNIKAIANAQSEVFDIEEKKILKTQEMEIAKFDLIAEQEEKRSKQIGNTLKKLSAGEEGFTEEQSQMYQDLVRERGELHESFVTRNRRRVNLLKAQENEAWEFERKLNNERDRADIERRAKFSKREEESLKTSLENSEMRLERINALREEMISELIPDKTFERTFFGEADPGGKMKEVYDQLSVEQREGIKRAGREAAEASGEVSEGLKLSIMNEDIWNTMLSMDEFKDANISIIEEVDKAQTRMGQNIEFVTSLIDDEYREREEILKQRLDAELFTQEEYTHAVFKLEEEKKKRIEKLNTDIEKSNQVFNDLREGSQKLAFDNEIRNIEDQDRLRIKQLEQRFADERNKVATQFGRNTKEYGELIKAQGEELEREYQKIDEERANKAEATAQDERRRIQSNMTSIRDIVTTSQFIMQDSINGSFESMRLGFESLRRSVMDPDNGILAIFENIQGSLNEQMAAILTGLELAISTFDMFLQNAESKARERRDASHAEETENLNNQLAEREISQIQFDDRMQDLEDQKKLREIASMREQFRREKSMNLAQAAINTAQAILQAIAQFGPPPSPIGIASMALAGGIGAAQMGLIAGQTFKASRGGVVPGQGVGTRDSVPSMLAPGEAVINSQSANMFPQLLSAINQAGGGISLAPDVSGRLTKSVKEDKPVRAYVVYSDIKEKEGFDRRSQQMNEF